MVCEYCSSPTKVVNSRLKKRQNQVWRRRQCDICGAVFTTSESSDLSSSWLVINELRKEPFKKEKLLISIYESLKHRKTAASDCVQLTETIIARLRSLIKQGEVTNSVVRETAYLCLSRFDKTAGSLYLAYRKDNVR